MNALVKTIKTFGYEVSLNGDNIKLSYQGEGEPNKDKVKSLIQELKIHKEDIVRELKKEKEENQLSSHEKRIFEDFEERSSIIEADGDINEEIENFEGFDCKLYSKTLDSNLWIVSDAENMRRLRRQGVIKEVIYTFSDIVVLRQKKEEAKKILSTIHKIKAIFPKSTIENLEEVPF